MRARLRHAQDEVDCACVHQDGRTLADASLFLHSTASGSLGGEDHVSACRLRTSQCIMRSRTHPVERHRRSPPPLRRVPLIVAKRESWPRACAIRRMVNEDDVAVFATRSASRCTSAAAITGVPWACQRCRHAVSELAARFAAQPQPRGKSPRRRHRLHVLRRACLPDRRKVTGEGRASEPRQRNHQQRPGSRTRALRESASPRKATDRHAARRRWRA